MVQRRMRTGICNRIWKEIWEESFRVASLCPLLEAPAFHGLQESLEEKEMKKRRKRKKEGEEEEEGEGRGG